MPGPEFTYVQARLQARHGNRPGAATWQILEASHTPGHYLALARAGSLAPWVDGLDEGGDVHRIERHLRKRWRHYVDDVARWLPARWQPATQWFGGLPALPLVTGGLAPEDPFAGAGPHPSKAGHPLPRGPTAPGDAAADWLDNWLQRVPAGDGSPVLLQRVAALLMPGLPGLHGLPGADGGHERNAGAEMQHRALLGLFRHHAASAVAVFAHLALVALDVERLRGGLVTRVLFNPAAPPDGQPQGT